MNYFVTALLMLITAELIYHFTMAGQRVRIVAHLLVAGSGASIVAAAAWMLNTGIGL